jgi:hypothetical protein
MIKVVIKPIIINILFLLFIKLFSSFIFDKSILELVTYFLFDKGFNNSSSNLFATSHVKISAYNSLISLYLNLSSSGLEAVHLKKIFSIEFGIVGIFEFIGGTS